MTGDRIEALEPDLLRVLAPNASPFTAGGTNSYVLGGGSVCVIDPGPADPAHLDALAEALDGRRVEAILVTHAHVDHSALAPALAGRTGAPVLAFGDALAGARPAPVGVGGGTGVDRAFRPDRRLADGEEVAGAGWRLVALHTPGHMGNHICLDDGRRLFTGDHAMGFATSLVSPPEGDMGDYMASLERLTRLGRRILLPGHGAPVPDGESRLATLLDHRRAREAQVLRALEAGPASAEELTGSIYAAAPERLRQAAQRNVLAHLIDLARRGLAIAEDPLAAGSRFRLP